MATLDQGKELPKVIEFIEFCIVSRGGWKVFPIRAAKMYRFFFWLVRRKNLGRSWASVLPYKRAVVRWAQSWRRPVRVDHAAAEGPPAKVLQKRQKRQER